MLWSKIWCEIAAEFEKVEKEVDRDNEKERFALDVRERINDSFVKDLQKLNLVVQWKT